MVKFKSIYSSIDFRRENDLLARLLENRKVEDVEAFLNVGEHCVFDGMLLKNMDKAIKCLDKNIQLAKKRNVVICVVVD